MDNQSIVLNCNGGKNFNVKIFVVSQKSMKSAKIFSLKKFRLYTVSFHFSCYYQKSAIWYLIVNNCICKGFPL